MDARFSSLQEKCCQLPKHKDPDKREQRAADGPGEKRGEISTAQEQRAAHVFLQHGAEDETQHKGSGIQIQAHEDIAYEAEQSGDENVVQVVVNAVGANTYKKRIDGKENAVRDS